jgi:CO/xanthine dehydrogenase Mo-binding subunit
MPFDAHGKPLAASLLDYLLPGATEVPPIRVLHMETGYRRRRRRRPACCNSQRRE